MRSQSSSPDLALPSPGFLKQIEAILRCDPGLTQSTGTARTLARLFGQILLFGILYGMAMGSFGGVQGDRSLQVVYSGIKAPLLLTATFCLSLPSFFMFNTLAGLRADFGIAVRALAASQAGLTVLLASLAPFTLLWNVSVSGRDAAVLFNGLMFGVATCGGQILLRRHYRPLIARNARHRLLLRVWGVTYAFVGIQMGWVLRPFVGDPHLPVRFLRIDSWGNAYVVVFKLIHDTLLR